MKLLLVRHPETKDNKAQKIQSALSGNLSEKGQKQIEQIVHRLKSEKIDMIYSSDSLRCKKLADAIAKEKNVEVSYEDLFREIKNGSWEGLSKEEIRKNLEKDPLHASAPDGESFYALGKRALVSFEYLKKQESSCILLVSHACFLKVMLGTLLGLRADHADAQIRLKNGSISEVQIEDGSFKVTNINNCSHLSKK